MRLTTAALSLQYYDSNSKHLTDESFENVMTDYDED